MHIQSSQSYGTLHVATHTYVHVRALCHVGRTIYMGNPACTKRSCYKECFGNNAGEKLREWYRSSVHKPTQKCTQLNGIDPVHVTKCGVRVCHHHQTGLLCTGLYTQQFKCVHKCMRLCEPAWVHAHVMQELKKTDVIAS